MYYVGPDPLINSHNAYDVKCLKRYKDGSGISYGDNDDAPLTVSKGVTRIWAFRYNVILFSVLPSLIGIECQGQVRYDFATEAFNIDCWGCVMAHPNITKGRADELGIREVHFRRDPLEPAPFGTFFTDGVSEDVAHRR